MWILWQEGAVQTLLVFSFQLYFYIIRGRTFTSLQALCGVLLIKLLINLNKIINSFDLENKKDMQNNNKNNNNNSMYLYMYMQTPAIHSYCNNKYSILHMK